MSQPPPAEPQVYLCSFPSSGRTWLRFMIAQVIASLEQRPERVTFNSSFSYLPNDSDTAWNGYPCLRADPDPGLPLIAAAHELYTPKFDSPPILWLYRDILDSLASRHLGQLGSDQPRPAPAFARSERGALGFARWANSWAPVLDEPRVLVLRYADLFRDTPGTLAQAVAHCGITAPADVIKLAVEHGQIDNMRRIEAADKPDTPGRKRVRTGGIGTHHKALADDERRAFLEVLNAELSEESKRHLRRLDSEPSGFDD